MKKITFALLIVLLTLLLVPVNTNAKTFKELETKYNIDDLENGILENL